MIEWSLEHSAACLSLTLATIHSLHLVSNMLPWPPPLYGAWFSSFILRDCGHIIREKKKKTRSLKACALEVMYEFNKRPSDV